MTTKSPRKPSLKTIRTAILMADDACGLKTSSKDPYNTDMAKFFKSNAAEAALKKELIRSSRNYSIDMEKDHPIFFWTLENNLEKLKEAIQLHPQDINRPLLTDGPNRGDLTYNYTPLHIACYFNAPALITFLIKAGADASLYAGKVSPLGLAAYSGQVEAFKTLTKLGVDVRLELKAEHSPGNAGSTLLHRLLLNHHSLERLEIVKTMLLSGQFKDPLPKTIQGESPLDSADPNGLITQWFRSYISALESLALEKSTPGPLTRDSLLPRKKIAI